MAFAKLLSDDFVNFNHFLFVPNFADVNKHAISVDNSDGLNFEFSFYVAFECNLVFCFEFGDAFGRNVLSKYRKNVTIFEIVLRDLAFTDVKQCESVCFAIFFALRVFDDIGL